MVQANDETETKRGQAVDDVVVPLRPDAARPRDPTNAERLARWRQNQRNGKSKKDRKNKKKREALAPTVTPSIVPPDAPPVVTETLLCQYPASAIQPLVPAVPFEPPQKAARAREATAQDSHAIDITAYAVAVALAGAAAGFRSGAWWSCFRARRCPWSVWLRLWRVPSWSPRDGLLGDGA